MGVIVAGAVTAQEFDLQVVEGLEVGEAVEDGTFEGGVVPQQVVVASDLLVHGEGAGVFVADLVEHARSQVGVFDEFGVFGGESEVGFRHDLRHVGDDGAEERPAFHVAAQLREARVVVTDPAFEGGARAVPAGQHDAAQRPRHHPRDGAQVGDRRRRFS